MEHLRNTFYRSRVVGAFLAKSCARRERLGFPLQTRLLYSVLNIFERSPWGKGTHVDIGAQRRSDPLTVALPEDVEALGRHI